MHVYERMRKVGRAIGWVWGGLGMEEWFIRSWVAPLQEMEGGEESILLLTIDLSENPGPQIQS